MSLTKQACSFVQVGLQSSGYHTSTTFFLPAKSESFTSFLSWFCNAKSGAVCPTPIVIFFPPISFESRYHLIEYGKPRQTETDAAAPRVAGFLVYTSLEKSAGRVRRVFTCNSPAPTDEAAALGW